VDPRQPLPLDRFDANAIVEGVYDASQSADSWRAMEKRKTRIDPDTAELLRRDPTLRKLAERIMYHEEKLREEREARGEDTSNDRPFLSLTEDEQHEVALRQLREWIAYHEAKLAEERAARGESAGQ
jgi:hypothetical protein